MGWRYMGTRFTDSVHGKAVDVPAVQAVHGRAENRHSVNMHGRHMGKGYLQLVHGLTGGGGIEVDRKVAARWGRKPRGEEVA